MKTYKFRSWDSVNEVMHQDVEHLDSLNEMMSKDKYDVMQFIGVKDIECKCIYEGDLVEFTPPVDKNSTFYNGNCGKIMVKNDIDQLLIRFNISEILSLDYDVFFLKGGKPVTDLYWFEKSGGDYSNATEKEINELNVPYSQHESDDHFIRYLADKGFKIIGNIYQNNYILSPTKTGDE